MPVLEIERVEKLAADVPSCKFYHKKKKKKKKITFGNIENIFVIMLKF